MTNSDKEKDPEIVNNEAEPSAAEETDIISDLERKIAEQEEQYLRLLAEYDNYRRRTARERESLFKDAQAAAISSFLPVADNIERAMDAPTTDPEFKKGIELIRTGFTQTLTRFGVERFGERGDAFDPQRHEAVAHVEDEAVEAGSITLVYAPGYKMGEKVLRHATVVVSG